LNRSRENYLALPYDGEQLCRLWLPGTQSVDTTIYILLEATLILRKFSTSFRCNWVCKLLLLTPPLLYSIDNHRHMGGWADADAVTAREVTVEKFAKWSSESWTNGYSNPPLIGDFFRFPDPKNKEAQFSMNVKKTFAMLIKYPKGRTMI
jgi:hypothetical protein